MESGQEERGQENEKRSGVAGEGRKVHVQGDWLSEKCASADLAVEPLEGLDAVAGHDDEAATAQDAEWTGGGGDKSG